MWDTIFFHRVMRYGHDRLFAFKHGLIEPHPGYYVHIYIPERTLN